MEEIDATLLSVDEIINLYPEAELPAVAEAARAAYAARVAEAANIQQLAQGPAVDSGSAPESISEAINRLVNEQNTVQETPSEVAEAVSAETLRTDIAGSGPAIAVDNTTAPEAVAAAPTRRRRSTSRTTPIVEMIPESAPAEGQTVNASTPASADPQIPQGIMEAAAASEPVAEALGELSQAIEETVAADAGVGVAASSTDDAAPVAEAAPESTPEAAQPAQGPQVTVEVQNNRIPNIPVDAVSTDIGSRFSGATWFDAMQRTKIIVAGCGGIGSWFTLLAARANPESIQLFDADVVESANLSGQLFSIDHVGMAKVAALASVVQTFCNYNRIETFQSFYTGRTRQVGPIMVCGFDNMVARKVFFYKWKEYAESHPNERCLFIDGRLNAEQYQVFCITGDRHDLMSRYESEWLFEDDEADGVLCSYKQTSYCAAMIGAMMNNLLVNFIFNGESNILYPRDLPFLTVYEADQLFLRTRV